MVCALQVALQEAKEFEASGKLPEGFFDAAPESDSQSENLAGNEETSSSSEDVGLLDSLDSSAGSEHKLRLEESEEGDGEDLLQGSAECHAWTNEVERSLSVMEQDNGWQAVLIAIDMEQDKHRRVCACTCMVCGCCERWRCLCVVHWCLSSPTASSSHQHARQRCLRAMRLVGLAPPAPYLGEITDAGVL